MLKSIQFKTKLFIIISIIELLLIGVLAFGFYNYSYDNIVESEYRSAAKVTNNISDQIDQLFKHMDIAAANVVYNKDIQNIINELNYSEFLDSTTRLQYERTIKATLSQIFFYIPEATKIAIYNFEKDYYFNVGLVDKDTYYINKQLNNLEWYQSIIGEQRLMKIYGPHQSYWSASDEKVLTLRRKFSPLGYNQTAIFEIQVPYRRLESICTIDNLTSLSNILIFNDNNDLIYPLDFDETDDNNQMLKFELSKTNDEYGNIRGSEGLYLYSIYNSDYTNWKVVMVTNELALQPQRIFYEKYIILVAIGIVAFTLIIYYSITQILTKPLRTLIQKVKSISLSNLNFKAQPQNNNDFHMLDKTFEEIIVRLNSSIKEVYELKLKEREAEYLALQAQISPHFLYNTLNSISVCCESGDTISSSKMCVQLSDIMRYITSNNKRPSIGTEIENVRNYLELMCVPYEGLLKYEIDVNENMLNLYIPKLILQPLVENSINHGLSKMAFPWFIK